MCANLIGKLDGGQGYPDWKGRSRTDPFVGMGTGLLRNWVELTKEEGDSI